MQLKVTRRALLGGAALVGAVSHGSSHAQDFNGPPSLPIGWPDQPAGTGFRIGHGYQTENTWYLPGYWHCGEDWYAVGRSAAGALVYALQSGKVVFVGSDYPGRVVIIRHADNLYSMYGHLSYTVRVAVGDSVVPGQVLGTVLARTDGRAPSHLHYEVRTFLTTADVNGPNPRYGFGCGPNCPPGPGYWPISAWDLPVDQGWRNPMHVYGWMLSNWLQSGAGEVAIAVPEGVEVTVWNHSPSQGDRRIVTGMIVESDSEPAILAIEPGRMSSRDTSAQGYGVWFQIEDDWRGPWINMVRPSTDETGSDGRPSSVKLEFVVQT